MVGDGTYAFVLCYPITNNRVDQRSVCVVYLPATSVSGTAQAYWNATLSTAYDGAFPSGTFLRNCWY